MLSDKKIKSDDETKPCVGPCYPQGYKFLHPITLEYMKGTKGSFCPIKPTINELGIPQVLKECKKPTNQKDIDTKSLEESFLVPNVRFNHSDFLADLYKITTLDEAVIWYNQNPSVSYKTIERIMDCALYVYGQFELSEKGISDFMIDFIKLMILNYWYDSYFDLLTPKMDIYTHKDGSIDLLPLEIESPLNKYTEKQKVQIKKMLESKLTNLFITTILQKYAQHYKNNWRRISKHFSKLSKFVYPYLENKLLRKK